MKITKAHLREVVREETQNLLLERQLYRMIDEEAAKLGIVLTEEMREGVMDWVRKHKRKLGAAALGAGLGLGAMDLQQRVQDVGHARSAQIQQNIEAGQSYEEKLKNLERKVKDPKIGAFGFSMPDVGGGTALQEPMELFAQLDINEVPDSPVPGAGVHDWARSFEYSAALELIADLKEAQGLIEELEAGNITPSQYEQLRAASLTYPDGPPDTEGRITPNKTEGDFVKDFEFAPVSGELGEVRGRVSGGATHYVPWDQIPEDYHDHQGASKSWYYWNLVTTLINSMEGASSDTSGISQVFYGLPLG